MKNKKFLTILLLLLSLTAYTREFKGSYELGYISIRINRVVESEFFPVYMDYKEEEPYIGIKSFFTFIGADDMKLDLFTLTAKGKIGKKFYDIDLKGTTYIIGKDEVFVRAKDFDTIFDTKKSEWNIERYLYTIELDFQTPYEIFLETEERLANFSIEEEGQIPDELIYTLDNKLISPGAISLRASNFDLEDTDTSFSFRYDTSLLYGDFSTSYFIAPDSEIGNISLKYNYILNDKSIVFGDSFPDTYDFLRTSEIRGISILDWDPNSELTLSNTQIRGQAPYRSTVELYRNGNLVAFQVVDRDGTYTFDNIRIQGFEDRYNVRIFTFEGTVETKEVSLYTNDRILEQGAFDYDFFVGRSSDRDIVDKDETQYKAKVYYGVTDRLTLGIGTLNIVSSIDDNTATIFDPTLIDDDDDDSITPTVVNDFIDASLYYTSPPIKYPIYIELGYLGSGATFVRFRQRFNRNYLSIEGYQYETELEPVTELKNQYEVTWRGPLRKDWSYSLGYNQFDELDSETSQFSVSELFYNGRSSSHTFGLLYPLSTPNSSEGSTFNYEYTNSGLSIATLPINLTAGALIDVENSSENAIYRLEISKRGDRDKDFSLGVEYDTQDFFIVLALSYKLTNWLEIFTEFVKDSDSNEINYGFDLEKTIILEKPLTKNSNPDVDASWMEGTVFSDTNGNDIFDQREQPIEGVGVKIGRENTITGEDGYYFFDGIDSYEREEVEIDPETIDPLTKSSQQYKYVSLLPARGGKLDIPVQPISTLTGNISISADGLSDIETYPIASRLFIILKDDDGNTLREKRIEPERFFVLEDILPGEYIMELDYRGNENISIVKNNLPITVNSGEYGDYYSGIDFEIIKNKEE